MRAWLLVALILTSGCLGAADTNPKNDPRPAPESPEPGLPGPEPEPPAPASPVTVLLQNFGFEGCAGGEVHVLVDSTDAQALLPDNFTIATGQGPTGHPAQSVARYRFLACDAFTYNGGRINDTVYGDIGLAIEDPDIHETGEGIWYRFAILAKGGDTLEAAWRTAGYDALAGDVTITDGGMSFGDYAITWTPGIPAGVLEEEVSFTKVPGSTIVWGEVVDETEPVQQALGTFTVPSSDPLSDLFEGDPLRNTIYRHTDTQIAEAAAVWVRDA